MVSVTRDTSALKELFNLLHPLHCKEVFAPKEVTARWVHTELSIVLQEHSMPMKEEKQDMIVLHVHQVSIARVPTIQNQMVSVKLVTTALLIHRHQHKMQLCQDTTH
jgi:hypothetical protein